MLPFVGCHGRRVVKMARLEFREQPQGQSQTSSQTAVLPANKGMGFVKAWGFSSTGPKSLEAVFTRFSCKE